MLTSSQKAHYQLNHYVVLPNFFDLQQMRTLKDRALSIVEQFDIDSTCEVFSTKDDHDRGEYFLNSADGVSCFFEEEAFDQYGRLKQSKALSINKIAHALHKYDEVFSLFSRTPCFGDIARAVGLQKPLIQQSMYIFKQARIGGEIRWHQDATYFLTHPSSVITFWLAIEDAFIDNGCLQVAKNARNFPLKEVFKRYPNDRTELISLHQRPWPTESTALEVTAGTLVIFDGNLPHYSNTNRSDKSRHAFTLHVTDGCATYDKHNWLQAEASAI